MLAWLHYGLALLGFAVPYYTLLVGTLARFEIGPERIQTLSLTERS